MTTIQPQESPEKKGYYRQSDIPLDSIIRQVATPSVLAEDKTINTQRVVLVNPLNIQTHIQAPVQTQTQTQTQAQIQLRPFVYQNSTQQVEAQAQFIGGTGSKTIPIPPEMTTIAPIRRV